jgi:hypothetical protein
MKFYVLDERHVWYAAIIDAANRHGFEGKRILRGEEVEENGYGFLRCHAEPSALIRNQRDFDLMDARLTMIQDEVQVRVYENKSAQFDRWKTWMPPTWRFNDEGAALIFVSDWNQYPLVSKADVGASSINVRILKNRHEALSHVRELFGPGIKVKHCSHGPGVERDACSLQHGYVLLQQFIPHKVTWRVNAIGTKRAAFMRYCYPDRAVAQTGNVEPVMKMGEQVEALFAFCDRFFDVANTKWCAVDVLQENDKWWLLETSLAWPWPSPGRCNSAPIFGTNKKWLQMFDVMMEEVQAGVWSKS